MYTYVERVISDTLRFLIDGCKLVSGGDVSRVCSQKICEPI